MADAPSKPKGKGLNGKIGPVPVKVALFVAVALVVFLYLRHRAKTTATSQGSESSPSSLDSGTPFQGQGDATGGGTSGGTGAGVAPPLDYTPQASQPFNFYFSSVPESTGGGNTSTPSKTTVASSSTPTSSFPDFSPSALQRINDADLAKTQSFNPGSYSEPERIELPDSVSGSFIPENQYGGPQPPVAPSTPPPTSNSQPYTTSVTANKTGGSANKQQGVFSVH